MPSLVFDLRVEHLFKSCDVLRFELCLEDLALKLLQLSLTQIAIHIFVTDVEYSLQGSFEVRRQLLLNRVEEGSYREENSSLSTEDHVKKVHVGLR